MGDLKWTNTGHVNTLQFLELKVIINQERLLTFQTFRKKMNLGLYIPPSSAHPSENLKSLVSGRVRAYFLHNSYRDTFINECYILTRNLLKRGWTWNALKQHFEEAESKLKKKGKANILAESTKK